MTCFINFISVENLSKRPAYLGHAEKKQGLKSRRSMVSKDSQIKRIRIPDPQRAQNISRGPTFGHFGGPNMLHTHGSPAQVKC